MTETETVLEALANPASEGHRHTQMKRMVLPLIRFGLKDAAIFAQFREMYESDVPDSEIKNIINWGRKRVGENSTTAQPRSKPGELTLNEAQEKALAWLNGFKIDEASLWEASQIRPSNDGHSSEDAILLFEYLYRPEELVCINTRFHVSKSKEGTEKATIAGPGETKPADEWIEHIKAHGTPQSRAGAWIRLNPLRNRHGSGRDYAHCDADVGSWRYLLLESDLLEPELALNVYARLALPIAIIVDSAGKGPHAWVTLNAQSVEEYTQKAKSIFNRLVTIGFDPGNSNPSRYGRLAGAKRIIGTREPTPVKPPPGWPECLRADGFQRLLYLAPDPKPRGIFS
jgi:hypothetical protein